MADPRVVLGAFAVIVDASGRVLLSHRRDMDLWNMPGGLVEGGETPWAAVVREVAEETGLQVTADSLSGVYCKTDLADVVFVFRCTIHAGRLQPTSEADRHAYFPLADLPVNTSRKQIPRLRDALNGGGPWLREQPGPRSRATATRRRADGGGTDPCAVHRA